MNMKMPRTVALLVTFGAAALARAAEPGTLSEDDIRWREKIGFNPQVHGWGANVADREFFPKLPFAYYPYANELEAVFDLDFAKALLPAGAPKPVDPVAAVTIRVLPTLIIPAKREEAPFYYGPEPAEQVDTNRAVAEFTLPLDEKGRGTGRFKLPKLEAGNYRVEYAFGGTVLTAAKTFRRTYFEWERNTLGLDHKVYAPFEPVRVAGRTVAVVDRVYTVNAVGLFDSVVSKGRELLAEPMKLVVETADGGRVEWKGGGVKGKATYPDLAVFETQAKCSVFGVRCSVQIEEDGCAKVQMTLDPSLNTEHRTLNTPIRRAWLEIALKDSEAPLCHFVGMNSMRHNYAGTVPRGGTITWINQPWRPARFEVEPFAKGETPASYEVWDATKNMNWGAQHWNFAPYVWLGAEERGLAWFGDHTAGYEVEDRTGRGIQRVSIEPGRVVLRVELIQKPVALTQARTFEFGLQASPTKPMRPDWRGYRVPGGGGMSVVVWGGFNCADKVPANRDWTIVDKAMAGAKAGKADWEWFAAYAKTNTTLINEGGGAKPGTFRRVPLEQAKANGQPWLTALSHFVGQAAGLGTNGGTTVYFEEHQTSGVYPDVAEFHDEWADNSFSRYRMFNYPFTWGPEARSANPESYRDFAVFYANEWMRRGIGIYYDNTYPQTDCNRHRLQDRGLSWQSSIWGHREYYKRVWKRSRELMASGQVTRPLHTVGHVTNCQILPYTTWWDATLGVESPSQWVPAEELTAEQRRKTLEEWGFLILPGPQPGKPGTALPYPPDYLRAMEGGRMAGLISHYRHSLRSEDAFGGLGISFGSTDKPGEEIRAHRLLSDKAMGMVHEIRGGGSPWDHDGIRTLMDAWKLYGSGKAAVRVHNYWAEKPFVNVSNPKVKWIAMEESDAGRDGRLQGNGDGGPRRALADADTGRDGRLQGNGDGGPRRSANFLLLLQSYDAAACETRLPGLPAGTAALDMFTRRLQDAAAPVTLEADYGTRLLLVGAREALAPLAWADGVRLRGDFEFGLPPGWTSKGEAAPRIVEDPQTPGNHVLRVTPGHPSQNYVGGSTQGDYTLTFRYRLPEMKERPPHAEFYGFLQMLHRQVGDWPKQSGQTLALGIRKNVQGEPALAVTYDVRREGQVEPFRNVTADRIKEVGSLIPLDKAWHTVSIAVRNGRHSLSLDGQEVFSGETDVTDGGALVIGPGWSGWAGGVAHVDVDELVVK